MTAERDADLTPHERTRQRRGARILDVAADLLLRHGYQRVTLEDIAQKTEIGKGTIYLHWKTKEALFGALMQREAVALWRLLLARVREDPQQVLFHRVLRSMLLINMQHPLARAMFTGDRELLGKLLRSGAGERLRAQQQDAQLALLRWMRGEGLLRTDLELEVQRYAIRSTVKGFLLAEGAPGETELLPEVRADALAHTIRHAFEPARLPTGAALATIAANMCDTMERMCEAYEQRIREPADAHDAPGDGR